MLLPPSGCAIRSRWPVACCGSHSDFSGYLMGFSKPKDPCPLGSRAPSSPRQPAHLPVGCSTSSTLVPPCGQITRYPQPRRPYGSRSVSERSFWLHPADTGHDPQERSVSAGALSSGCSVRASVGSSGTAAVGYSARLGPVSYTHLRAHETVLDLVCR